MGRAARDEDVRAAALRILSRHHTVVSQRRFAALVSKELANLDPPAAITPQRLRRIMTRTDFCRLEYKSREGSKQKVLHACPICGGRLRKGRNQTLFGGEVTLMMRCSDCSYWTGRGKRQPTLYTFHLRSAGAAVEAEAPFAGRA